MITRAFTLIFLALLVLNSCKSDSKNSNSIEEEIKETTFLSFGKEIIPDDAIKISSMADHYGNLQVGDSIQSKMKATVNEVCQAKGCWMTLDLGEDKEVMVKFKDYGFFVPKDISGKEVIVNGKAYVTEMSVEEQQHYAQDAGESEDVINQITAPKKTYLFEADGVLVAQ